MRINKQEGDSRGFTLIELLVSTLIAMVLLAGIVGIFISQNKAANMVTDKTDRLSDMFLASQIMQTALRDAQAICWDAANKRIIYQPLDSTVAVTDPCTAAVVDAQNGFFRFNAATATQTAQICWDRPNLGGGCQELIRDLKDATGMQIVPVANTNLKGLRQIILTARAQNLDRIDRDVFLEFRVWPRN